MADEDPFHNQSQEQPVPLQAFQEEPAIEKDLKKAQAKSEDHTSLPNEPEAKELLSINLKNDTDIHLDDAIHLENEELDLEDDTQANELSGGIIGLQAETDPHTVDVPDKGNCLFCAASVGMKLIYKNNESIQKRLDWDVDAHSLTGDLSHADSLLDPPSDRLRQQAAEHLEKNRQNPEVAFSIMGGIIDHNEVALNKIQDEQAALFFLEEDITFLKKRLQQLNPVSQKEAYRTVSQELEKSGSTCAPLKNQLSMKRSISFQKMI